MQFHEGIERASGLLLYSSPWQRRVVTCSVDQHVPLRMTAMNGSLPSQSQQITPNMNKQATKAPEFVPVESNNWLIHTRYARREFDICKLIIEEDLIRTKGCNEYANYILGLIYRNEGKVREALECFQKCCFLNPHQTANVRQLGRSWFLLGQKYQAIEAYSRAEKMTEEPEWSTYHNMGVCYAELGQIGKARDCLTKAVNLGRTRQSYEALAKLYISENDMNSALETYQVALQLFPSSSDLASALGHLYLQVGEIPKAFNNFGLALSLDKENMEPLLAVASICQDENEHDIALSKYKIAGQRLPESVCLWNNMGLCFFGKGKYVAAISCLKRANYLDAMDWKTLYNLGLVHIHTKQYTSAFHFLSSAIKLENRHSFSFMLLAIALQKLSYNENATKCFEQAIKLDVDDVTVRINFTSHLNSIGQKELALEQLNVIQRLLQQFEIDDKTHDAVRQLTALLTQDLFPQPARAVTPSESPVPNGEMSQMD